MGLFDKWRRKSDTKKPAIVRRREYVSPARPVPKRAEQLNFENMTPEVQQQLVTLVAEYERLSIRRDQLQRERSELTNKLDNGEITAIKFRKQLMEKIQEASLVNENLRITSNRLASLGYRGVFI